MREISLQETVAKADVVFVGTALKIKGKADGYTQYMVEFDVVAWIKGGPSDSIIVRTETHTAACGYPFGESIEYLVYGYSRGGSVSTNICSRTRRSEHATVEIQLLLNPESIQDVQKINVKELAALALQIREIYDTDIQQELSEEELRALEARKQTLRIAYRNGALPEDSSLKLEWVSAVLYEWRKPHN